MGCGCVPHAATSTGSITAGLLKGALLLATVLLLLLLAAALFWMLTVHRFPCVVRAGNVFDLLI